MAQAKVICSMHCICCHVWRIPTYFLLFRNCVVMLVDRKVQDDLGGQAELKYTRLRYELEITLQSDGHDPDRLHVAYESLKPISRNEDNWCKKYGISSQNN